MTETPIKLRLTKRKLVAPHAFGAPKGAIPTLVEDDLQGGYATTYAQGAKFVLVETIDLGWMDGHGEKHLLMDAQNKRVYYRGSLKRAFVRVAADRR